MIIERDKIYLRRNGGKVRIVCVDAVGEQPIVGVDLGDGDADKFNEDGCYFPDGETSGQDLVSEYVEPPKPRECWVYVSGEYFGAAYTAEQRAEGLKSDPNHTAKLVLFREVIE